MAAPVECQAFLWGADPIDPSCLPRLFRAAIETCGVCGAPVRVIASTDRPLVIEK